MKDKEKEISYDVYVVFNSGKVAKVEKVLLDSYDYFVRSMHMHRSAGVLKSESMGEITINLDNLNYIQAIEMEVK